MLFSKKCTIVIFSIHFNLNSIAKFQVYDSNKVCLLFCRTWRLKEQTTPSLPYQGHPQLSMERPQTVTGNILETPVLILDMRRSTLEELDLLLILRYKSFWQHFASINHCQLEIISA